MGTSEEDLESLMGGFPQSSSKPLLNWNASPFQMDLHEPSTQDMAHQGVHPLQKSTTHDMDFQRRASASLLQGSTTDNINSERGASPCVLQGPSYSGIPTRLSSSICPCPPSQIVQSPLSLRGYLNHQRAQPDNEAVARNELAGLHTTPTQHLIRQLYEDAKSASYLDYHDNTTSIPSFKEQKPIGSGYGMFSNNHGMSIPPFKDQTPIGSGYGMLSNNHGMATWSVEGSCMEGAPTNGIVGQEVLPMKKSPSNDILGSEALSTKQIPSQGITGIEALSMKRSPSSGIMGTQVPFMMRSPSIGNLGMEGSSMKSTPSNGTFGNEILSMTRSHSNGIFGIQRNLSNINFETGGLSSFDRSLDFQNALLAQDYERLMYVPEVYSNLERPQDFNSNQEGLHARDNFKPFDPSSFVMGASGGTARYQDLDRNKRNGCSLYKSQDKSLLFSEIQLKRLELQELESKLHLQSLQSRLRESLSHRASDISSAPVNKQYVKYDKQCKYYASGKCTRGKFCAYVHLHEDAAEAIHNYPERVDFHKRSQSDGNLSLLTSLGSDSSFVPLQRSKSSLLSRPLNLDNNKAQQQDMFKSLEGKMVSAAKEQLGCRILQRKMEEGNPEDLEKICEEIIKADIAELTMDPFANYLIQKMVEVCCSIHFKRIVEELTKQENLLIISLNVHGTRVVQKLIERLENHDQASLVISSLERGIVRLVKDPYGNHVVQRCLQHLSNDDCQFIFNAVSSHCEELALDRFGCCVLQRCLDSASESQKKQLVAEISACAFSLSQDRFGNYVVQYILDLNLPWASKEVILKFQGRYAELAVQKYSSNVVEKCLKGASDDDRVSIVKELMESSVLSQLLRDPYANYVIQSALEITQGSLPVLHTSLVKAIQSYEFVLCSSTYGRRILSCPYLET